MMQQIYLDYAATTPVDPAVATLMGQCLTLDGTFGNPASNSHSYGWMAQGQVEQARTQLAQLLGCDARDLVWTSGATESDNLAIKGVVEAHGVERAHVVTSSIEHKAVLDTCRYLEARGCRVTYLAPKADGRIGAEQVAQALTEQTVLVSIMHANNELGTVNDLAAIGAICREQGVLFHSDAAQSVGRLPIDLAQLPVDLLSISAHKFYGPKGIGALYVRRRPPIELQPLIHGGGHERGLRSGTLATHQIAGLGLAAELARLSLADEAARLSALRDQLWLGIADLDGVQRNGAVIDCLPNILNVSFGRIDGEVLLAGLSELAVSSGSACNSASLSPSFVLKAIGLSDALALSAIRFSLGRYTDAAQIEQAIAILRRVIPTLARR